MIHITFHIESREEYDHCSHICNHHPVHATTDLTRTPLSNLQMKNVLNNIQHIYNSDYDKLNKLKLCEIGSPPALKSKTRTQIMSIHQHVNK